MPARTTARPAAGRVPAPLLALASMLCIQLGVAVSAPLLDELGGAGTAWLRLCWAAVLVTAVVRLRWWRLPAPALGGAALLGLASAAMTLSFFEAVERLPLGTASALEFCGPLAVALLARGRGGGLLWPLLAAAGVVCLTRPWSGALDPAGVGFALLAAAGCAAYILLTQRSSGALDGLQTLAVSFPVAALAATAVAAPSAAAHVTWDAVLVAAGAAVLVPVVPYALELAALRRMSASAFGTLTSADPAIAGLVGLVLLHERPTLWQAAGTALVVAAGVGSQRTGRRGRAAAAALPVQRPAPAGDLTVGARDWDAAGVDAGAPASS